jgi:ssDNA-binding Zn-finger/Zn-ribbon topoisomerase 1
VIISIECEIHILSIHPNRKQREPTKQIIIPQKAVPLVFPESLLNNSPHENFDIFDNINKSYFLLYIKYENDKNGYINPNMKELKILRTLYKSKHEHFLSVDFDFYQKWKWIIKLIVFFNKEYISCEIFRKKYKFHRRFVVIGLKWGGKNVKRRTSGFAKEFLQWSRNPKCIYCENQLTIENATSDHIIPISKGGNNCQVNLVVVCNDCNSQRGNLDFYEYLRIKNPTNKNKFI